ncbi:hypothetical protein, partial [Porphyromonas gingivalis]|uniref:hypothetical protein n=1 Tax=Porphyromonas gingivalis TaxID=837 RepID=UPI0011817140
ITTFADVLVPLFHSHADLLHRDYGFISRCGSSIQADEARPDDPLTINLGREVILRAFTYAPYKAEAKPTTAVRYRLAVSEDG